MAHFKSRIMIDSNYCHFWIIIFVEQYNATYNPATFIIAHEIKQTSNLIQLYNACILSNTNSVIIFFSISIQFVVQHPTQQKYTSTWSYQYASKLPIYICDQKNQLGNGFKSYYKSLI